MAETKEEVSTEPTTTAPIDDVADDDTLCATFRLTENILDLLCLWVKLMSKPTKEGKTFVLFECGTVVAVDGTEKRFMEFAKENYHFPLHRIGYDLKRAKKIVKDNQARWQRQKGSNDVARAYQVLMEDGYPLPGGPPSDRLLIPLWGEGSPLAKKELAVGAWQALWPNRSRAIYNFVADTGTAKEADAMLADLRRWDHMSPSAYAVVKSDGTVTRIRIKKEPADIKNKFPAPDKSVYAVSQMRTTVPTPGFALRHAAGV